MRVLLVKTSSLGDLIHAMPALTDARRHLPGIRFHWLVEETFAQIPALHPAVEAVIPCALRRWRRQLPAVFWRRDWRDFRARLAAHDYDLVLDSQGLLKSAWLARLARGERAGYDGQSARESWAAWHYQRRLPVPRGLHAITRQRRLFAQALGYASVDEAQEPPRYGIESWQPGSSAAGPVALLHGTSWPSKRWPTANWLALGRLLDKHQVPLLLPWGNAEELARAEFLATRLPNATVTPALGLAELAATLGKCRAAVGVDGGPTHLAAALGLPVLALHGASDAGLTAPLGRRAKALVATYPCVPCLGRHCKHERTGAPSPPCYATLHAGLVWQTLQGMLAGS